jgi:hypothetical protein
MSFTLKPCNTTNQKSENRFVMPILTEWTAVERTENIPPQKGSLFTFVSNAVGGDGDGDGDLPLYCRQLCRLSICGREDGDIAGRTDK